MSRPISDGARKTMEAMAFRLEHDPISDEKLEALIAWAESGEPPSPEKVTRGDLLNALMELAANRRLR
jgi:hypothetical protein